MNAQVLKTSLRLADHAIMDPMIISPIVPSGSQKELWIDMKTKYFSAGDDNVLENVFLLPTVLW